MQKQTSSRGKNPVKSGENKLFFGLFLIRKTTIKSKCFNLTQKCICVIKCRGAQSGFSTVRETPLHSARLNFQSSPPYSYAHADSFSFLLSSRCGSLLDPEIHGGRHCKTTPPTMATHCPCLRTRRSTSGLQGRTPKTQKTRRTSRRRPCGPRVIRLHHSFNG